MKKEVAVKILQDIMPGTDNHIRRALQMAIASLKSDKVITIYVNHSMQMPSIADMMKDLQGPSPKGNPLKAFDMFSKENLDKLFGGE